MDPLAPANGEARNCCRNVWRANRGGTRRRSMPSDLSANRGTVFVAKISFAVGTEFSTEKARRELGFESRPLRDTLADTMEWFTRAGMLA